MIEITYPKGAIVEKVEGTKEHLEGLFGSGTVTSVMGDGDDLNIKITGDVPQELAQVILRERVGRAMAELAVAAVLAKAATRGCASCAASRGGMH